MKTIFIDVREPFEFQTGHVDGAINIPINKLMAGEPDELKGLARDTKIVAYCRSGARANACISTLKSMGFTQVENGINADTITRSS